MRITTRAAWLTGHCNNCDITALLPAVGETFTRTFDTATRIERSRIDDAGARGAGD